MDDDAILNKDKAEDKNEIDLEPEELDYKLDNKQSLSRRKKRNKKKGPQAISFDEWARDNGVKYKINFKSNQEYKAEENNETNKNYQPNKYENKNYNANYNKNYYNPNYHNYGRPYIKNDRFNKQNKEHYPNAEYQENETDLKPQPLYKKIQEYYPKGSYFHQTKDGVYIYPSRAIFVQQVMWSLLVQLEFYFSSNNLCNDSYIREIMDEEGYVTIKELAKFPRIKYYTTDYTIIIQAVKNTKGLELSEDGLKCRRKNDWKAWVINKENLSNEKLTTLE